MKRFISFLLAMAVTCSMMPSTAFASEIQDKNTASQDMSVLTSIEQRSPLDFVSAESRELIYLDEPLQYTKTVVQDFYSSGDADSLLTSTASDYAYNDLLLRSNGENRQKLYQYFVETATNFWKRTDDLAQTDEGYYVIDAYNISDYGLTETEAIEVYYMFRDDHPLFYFASSGITIFESTFYFMTEAEYASGTDRQRFQNWIQPYIEQYSTCIEGKSAFADVLSIHDQLNASMEYAYAEDGVTPSDDANAHNILGAIGWESGVCEAYARTYQMLLNYYGFDNILVAGDAGSEAHMWNLVKLEDAQYYYVDCTWDDADASLNYFAVGSNILHESHTPNSPDGIGTAFQYALPEISAENYVKNPGEEITSGDYVYTVNARNQISIIKYIGSEEHVVVPAEIDGIPVYRICQDSFYGGDGISMHGDLVVKSITFSEGIRYLEPLFVYFFDVLEKVVIPSTMEVSVPNTTGAVSGVSGIIGDGCNQLAKIEVSEDNPWLEVVDDVVYSEDMSVLMAYPPAREGTVFTVPDSVVLLNNDAFSGNSILEEVILPDTLEWIGYWAFTGCTALERVNIPSACEFIGQFAFKSTNLSHVTIPAGLDGIGPGAFAFTPIVSFEVEEGNQRYSTDGKSLIVDDELLFSYACGSQDETYTIPDQITTIIMDAFAGCEALKSVDFGNSVATIENSAFFNCKSLNSIILPVSLELIESSAFGNVPLQSIYYYGSEETWENITLENNPIKSDTAIIFNYDGSVDDEEITIQVEANGDEWLEALNYDLTVNVSGGLIVQEYQFQHSADDGETWVNVQEKETCEATIESDDRTAHMMIPDLYVSDTGLYRCAVTGYTIDNSEPRTIYSEAVRLQVKEIIITKQPDSVIANAGEEVNFQVQTNLFGDIPEASEEWFESYHNWFSYYWMYSNDNGETWQDGPYVGSDAFGQSTFTFTAGEAENGYLYRCRIEYYDRTLFSDAVSLTVISQEETEPTTEETTIDPFYEQASLNGDVDGDGSITQTDVVYLMKYVTDAEGYGILLQNNGDVNLDGLTNLRDVIILQRHLSDGYYFGVVMEDEPEVRPEMILAVDSVEAQLEEEVVLAVSVEFPDDTVSVHDLYGLQFWFDKSDYLQIEHIEVVHAWDNCLERNSAPNGYTFLQDADPLPIVSGDPIMYITCSVAGDAGIFEPAFFTIHISDVEAFYDGYNFFPYEVSVRDGGVRVDPMPETTTTEVTTTTESTTTTSTTTTTETTTTTSTTREETTTTTVTSKETTNTTTTTTSTETTTTVTTTCTTTETTRSTTFSKEERNQAIRNIDVDQDGTIDAQDCLNIAKSICGYLTLPVEGEAAEGCLYGDANLDGTVNLADVVNISQYLMGAANIAPPQEDPEEAPVFVLSMDEIIVARPGDIVEVPIYVQNFTGDSVGGFDLNFEIASELSVYDMECGVCSNVLYQFENAKVLAYDYFDVPLTDGTTLMTLFLRIPENTPNGTYDIGMSSGSVCYHSEKSYLCDAQMIGGFISVEDWAETTTSTTTTETTTTTTTTTPETTTTTSTTSEETTTTTSTTTTPDTTTTTSTTSKETTTTTSTTTTPETTTTTSSTSEETTTTTSTTTTPETTTTTSTTSEETTTTTSTATTPDVTETTTVEIEYAPDHESFDAVIIIPEETGKLEIVADSLQAVFDEGAVAAIRENCASEKITLQYQLIVESDSTVVSEILEQGGKVFDLSFVDENGGAVPFATEQDSVTLTIPYEAEDPTNQIMVYYIAADGTKTDMHGVYHAETKTVVFQTSHFSLYTIEEIPSTTSGDPSLPQTGYSELYRVILIAAATLVFLGAYLMYRSRKENA